MSAPYSGNCDSSTPERDGTKSDTHALLSEALQGVAGTSGEDAVLYARIALSVTCMPPAAVAAYTSHRFAPLEFFPEVASAMSDEELARRQLDHKVGTLVRLACDITIGSFAANDLTPKQATSVLETAIDAAVGLGAAEKQVRDEVRETVEWMWATNIRASALPGEGRYVSSVTPNYIGEVAAIINATLPSTESVVGEATARIKAKEAREEALKNCR